MFNNEDMELLKEYLSLDKNNENNIKEFINDFSKNDNNFEYSQKIVPFSFLEFGSPNNIIHTQWKELCINRKINNLLYNFVTLGFPIYVVLEYLKNFNLKKSYKDSLILFLIIIMIFIEAIIIDLFHTQFVWIIFAMYLFSLNLKNNKI